ncbi:MAG: hypothetical protein AB1798_21420 [Spirochaetota bacterium]
MNYFDYTNLKQFVHDDDLLELLSIDTSFPVLVDLYLKDDFLEIDTNFKIPFFAVTRDYAGACEKKNPQVKWIVKPIKDSQQLQTEMAMICYFLDFFTKTVSAPIILSKIGNILYKASKIVPKAEQLSGANYTEIVQMREQLLLDLINRWIYYDEDRNPNNYMIKYNSRNDQIVIAIDFSNVDLLFEGIKIEGTTDKFGWQRMEKTRYLTPLKIENFMIYDMTFFNMRFNEFKKIESNFLHEICNVLLSHNPEREQISLLVATNIMRRIDYVYNYFDSKFPLHHVKQDGKYKDMGKAFTSIYDEFK